MGNEDYNFKHVVRIGHMWWIEWCFPLPQTYFYLEHITVTLFGNRIFAEVIKLWILQWDNSGLRWALNPRTDDFIRERRREMWGTVIQRERSYEDGGRDWSHATMIQGTPRVTPEFGREIWNGFSFRAFRRNQSLLLQTECLCPPVPPSKFIC